MKRIKFNIGIVIVMSVILIGCKNTPTSNVLGNTETTAAEADTNTESAVIESNESTKAADTEDKSTEILLNENMTEQQTEQKNPSEKINTVGAMVSSISKTDFTQFDKIEELNLAEDASNEFAFSTDCILNDLKIQSISYDGVNCNVEEILYEAESFTPETALKIKAYIPPTFSNILVSYVEPGGKSINYFIECNMSEIGVNVILRDASKVIQDKDGNN